MALGASPAQIRTQFLNLATRLLLAGIAIGHGGIPQRPRNEATPVRGSTRSPPDNGWRNLDPDGSIGDRLRAALLPRSAHFSGASPSG